MREEEKARPAQKEAQTTFFSNGMESKGVGQRLTLDMCHKHVVAVLLQAEKMVLAGPNQLIDVTPGIVASDIEQGMAQFGGKTQLAAPDELFLLLLVPA